MSSKETIAGAIAGGVMGLLTALVTAWGKAAAVRKEFEGKLELLREEWRQKSAAEASAEENLSQAAKAARREALAQAATKLISALQHPSSYGVNLGKAREQVDEATSALLAAGELVPLAEGLKRASQHDDIDEAQRVLAELQHS